MTLYKNIIKTKLNVDLEKIKKLYESLPRRIEEVIKMKGRNTHY